MLTDKQKQELGAKLNYEEEIAEVVHMNYYWDLVKLENGDVWAVPRYYNTDSTSFAPYKTLEKQWQQATR